jgi:hypothetical protein
LTELIAIGHAGEGGHERPFDHAICAVVSIGTLTGKPVTAHKVASILGFPRTTVSRRLSRLKAIGHLNQDARTGQYTMPPDRYADRLDTTIKMVQAIARACDELRSHFLPATSPTGPSCASAVSSLSKTV